MDSEDELVSFEMKPRKPPKLPKLKLNKPKPSKRLKNNRISSPEIESIADSGTSDITSHNSDVFLAKSRPLLKRTTKLISEDEISNQSTLDDDQIDTVDTETSQDSKSPKTTTQTEAKTYRDKLKERFRSVKQQSSFSFEKSALKKFKSRSQDVLNLNKSIDNLRQDNHNINLQLKAHKRYVYQGDGEVSSAEKYQFFCETAVEEQRESEEGRDEIVVVERRAESMKELLIKSYEELIWSPKSSNLSHELESEGRDLLGEGLFVAEGPKIPQRHLRLLKQRLIASENDEFFDESGQLKFAESNYSSITYRPDRFDDESPFELTYHKPSTTVPSNISSVIIAQSQPTLEINIQGFRFTNHPLFTPEHVHQEELIRLFDVHKGFRRSQKREKLWERLESSRASKIKQIEAQNASGDAQPDNSSSVALLTKQIKQLREDFYKECKLYRENVKSVLATWKTLKKLRTDNGYSTTTIKLIISKHADVKVFYDDPEILLEEIRTEKDEEYQEKMSKYRKELQAWRNQVEDDEAIAEEKPIKPPRTISAKRLRGQVEGTIQETFGDKGEPMITFTLNYSHMVTPAEEVDENERNRRKFVENTKVKLKLLLNNILICKSKATKLNSNFTLNFDEVLSLKLLGNGKETDDHEKQNIEVQLFETKARNINKSLLCSTEITIPKTGQVLGQTTFEEVYFHGKPDTKLSGFLTFCIGWDSVATSTRPGQNNILNSDGGLNVDELQHWIDESNPDPEDPRNAIIFEYLREKQSNASDLQRNDSKIFRCDPHLESFTICGKEDVENNVRLQLLRLRDRNEPEFVGMMVPNRLNEIPSNIFATYERRLAEERYQEYLDQDDEICDDIVSKRSLGRKYLRQIHMKVFMICRNCENNLSFEDVIDEKMVPWIQNYLKTMLSNFLNWFRLQPTLNKPLPLLDLRKEVECINHKNNANQPVGKICIVINLKSGINLPSPSAAEKVSSGRKRGKSKASAGSIQDTDKPMQYFVEISHGKTTITSGLSQSKNISNPQWNETLRVPLESENLDYSNPNSLNGVVEINLFQKFDEDDDNSVENYNDDEESELRGASLGCVVIPIAATASENRLEGEFPLKTPPFIYGYEKEEEMRSPSTPRVQMIKNQSYLEMSVYCDSTIPKINADLGSIASGEPPFVRDHILEWNKRFNLEHPKRKFSTLAIDTNGKTVCLTRYIKALEPPKLNTDEFDVSLEQCARFVSLIPFSRVNKFYENVWLTGEQVLKLGIGSIYDHATLLTCYLLSLKVEVWLLLGFGIPDGNTAYVLMREYNDTPLPNHFIIDVTNGVKYNVTDQYCPLKKVYCVIDDNNIWANVQRGDAVFTTRFDFTRKFDWQAVFNNTISCPSNSIQHNLHYLQSGDEIKLQSVIEKKLQKKIAKIRDQDVTMWNHALSNMLRTQIHKAEKNFMHGKTHLASNGQIDEYSKHFKINGNIQCLRFSSVNEIVEEVLRTKTWNIYGSNVEFASCVQVHAYVNQVIAVWVAFVSVVKR